MLTADFPSVNSSLANPNVSGASTSSSRMLLELLRLCRNAESSLASDTAEAKADVLIAKPVLRSLLAALRLRDADTVQHVRRTALIATGLARFLSWDAKALRALEIAALLHDIGKIGVPDHVLFKPGPLSPAERELIGLQHQVSIDVLQACRVHSCVLEIINQANVFHEPDATPTHEPPLGARILAISDAYDSLSNKQVFREALPHDEIMKILAGSAGTHFDGNLVSVLNRWIQSEGLPFGRELKEPPNLSANGFFQMAEEMQASSMCHIFSYLYGLESMYDGFYVADSDLRFRVWNHGMEQLLGRSATDTVGQLWNARPIDYADASGRALSESRHPMRQVIKTGKPSTGQVQVLCADGSWILAEVMSLPLIDHNGQMQGVAEIFRDLSQDRRRRSGDKELKKQATSDSLTGVANRGELERSLESMLADFHLNPDDSEPLSVIFLDVDHFKLINDTYLHLTGDQVLINLAKLLENETYSGELIGRYGGEEFVVLCPGTSLPDAIVKAERLRSSIAAAKLSKVDDLKITVSFGVTEVEPGDKLDDLFRRADQALFTSKEQGRNRTTALSREDFQNGGTGSKASKEPPVTYVCESSFLACVTPDTIKLKFGSFVVEQKAKLVRITDDKMIVRMGSTFLPFWGTNEKHQPIEIQITFGPPPKTASANRNTKQAVSPRTFLQVRIVPRGWPSDVTSFQFRAKRAFRLLKSYFVAD